MIEAFVILTPAALILVICAVDTYRAVQTLRRIGRDQKKQYDENARIAAEQERLAMNRYRKGDLR